MTKSEFHILREDFFNKDIFDLAIKEFFILNRELSNYIDATQDKNIFDYIPPQRTNQIFTPRQIVASMVDELEKFHPNILGDPDKKFVDIHMKSGMLIVAIVKRLFLNDNLRKIFPISKARLEHIFENQV